MKRRRDESSTFYIHFLINDGLARMQSLLLSFNLFGTHFSSQCVDACALQMCLESLEPKQENFSGPTPRWEWCDEVLSLKVPVEAMIGKAFKDRPPVGPKSKAILTQCRFT